MRSLISGKEGEIHSSVFAMLQKTGVGCKGVRTRVFKYKYALFIQDVCTKYEVGKLSQTGVIKGRVCKNYIEGLSWFLQVLESISPDNGNLLHLQAPACLLNKFEVQGCHLNGKHRSRSPGGKFIGDAACTREKVQYIQVFDIVLVNQDVKEALFCKIGGGPGLEICRWTNLLASEYAAYYTHLLPSERIM